ncbi:MAG: hypothetical protein J1F09_02605 [Oscillospiraceae bacterium]|nr:hypothetical protein [Oscillospiraceae bacterium]
MNTNTEVFNKKAELLWEKLTENVGKEQIDGFASLYGRSAAFISVSDTEERAYVFRASAQTPEAAWEKVTAEASEFISSENFNPVWVKADITLKGERKAFSKVIEELSNILGEFFRRGIAFDDDFETAFIEAELNGNYLINYKEKTIELTTLNNYLAGCELKTLTQFPDEVILFDCKSAFCDEKSNIFELYSEGNNCGRRVTERFDKELALRVISTSADYLAMQIGLDGKFDYGVYPIFHKEIAGYNILRHATSIWSLLCAYRITGEKFILQQAESAINYMISNASYKYPNKDGRENVLYLIDKTRGEVKIGGNAVAIIMLTEYMNIVGNTKYEKLAVELGNGILELFDERDGSFFHVLKYPSLAPRDKFRTVYYDGETVFALSRLFGLTKKRRFLEAAQAAANRFIKKDYTRYADHWVAYALNELTKYLPEEKYLNFALRNVQVNLERIYNQPTTYHTFLELLCVSFELYTRIKEQKLKCGYLKEFDEKFFIKTIFRRAEYMLNGYGYPEYVMYFQNPDSALGSFFVRHDDFRMRIDDIQHFCGAYYSLYRNYEKLDALRED